MEFFLLIFQYLKTINIINYLKIKIIINLKNIIKIKKLKILK